MPVFMSDYGHAEQRSSIDVTINTVEKYASARIRQDSEIVVEMTEHSQLQEVSLQSLTLNREEQKEEPGMCEEVVPENEEEAVERGQRRSLVSHEQARRTDVDVAYTDIGVAIRSQESAKDNEAVSRRSELPMDYRIESEVSKKTKSSR
jgi:hypothetical protein